MRFCRGNADCRYEGVCYAVWVDPTKVSDVAVEVMTDAGHSLPLLLANRVRAQCCDHMGRKFDEIMKRSPQVQTNKQATSVQLEFSSQNEVFLNLREMLGS